MIQVSTQGVYCHRGQWLDANAGKAAGLSEPAQARQGTIAYRILRAHAGSGSGELLRIRFDALVSHDITYVGIVQTARAGGMKEFPLPYALTNCHNSLCAVGGTINEDDHLFGLSAARKYGGDYVPPHVAVIHQYAREMLASCGKMILGSDSHTRYGPLGTMGFGEGGPELVKQLLGHTYDLAPPDVIAVYLEGAPRPGVGPQDVALALIKAVFKAGTVKNRILEFIGPGIGNLSVDYRLGIDVMTTETACLSSVWTSDDTVRQWFAEMGRPQDFKELAPLPTTWYDGCLRIDLTQVEPMIALPFHPSNAWTIREFLSNADDLLAGVEKEAAEILGRNAAAPALRTKYKNGVFMADQGIVAGCSGSTYESMYRVGSILQGKSVGNGAFSLSVYPASLPQFQEMVRSGLANTLIEAGVTIKTAFCGPCFGAGDVPANNAFSIRHTTRNFPNREGSKPSEGQMSYVALMDARSIAATAANQGRLTAATDLADPPREIPVPYTFNPRSYETRVYRGFGKADPDSELILGPNITDWPTMPTLPENLILTVASAIYDPVTTTDELIPSGETSSLRSNPLRLAEFALSRKDPEYVGRARAASAMEVKTLLAELGLAGKETHTGLGSLVFALKPGDGSAREQAASSQKVLGGWANIASEYATKRYRANLVNWGMLPFILDDAASFGIKPGDRLFLPGIRQALAAGLEEVPATLFQNGERRQIVLRLPGLSKEERDIILAGCLINYYAGK